MKCFIGRVWSVRTVANGLFFERPANRPFGSLGWPTLEQDATEPSQVPSGGEKQRLLQIPGALEAVVYISRLPFGVKRKSVVNWLICEPAESGLPRHGCGPLPNESQKPVTASLSTAATAKAGRR